jgi:hypothetical protein
MALEHHEINQNGTFYPTLHPTQINLIRFIHELVHL